jgi:hypothetical protein
MHANSPSTQLAYYCAYIPRKRQLHIVADSDCGRCNPCFAMFYTLPGLIYSVQAMSQRVLQSAQQQLQRKQGRLAFCVRLAAAARSQKLAALLTLQMQHHLVGLRMRARLAVIMQLMVMLLHIAALMNDFYAVRHS